MNQNFLWICTSSYYVLHYCKVSWNSVERFQRSCAEKFIFHFAQISKFKKGVALSKKNRIKISCGYAHWHIMSFITTKINEILLSGFRGVALTRKTGLIDWLMDGSKTLYPAQLVAWGIKIYLPVSLSFNSFNCSVAKLLLSKVDLSLDVKVRYFFSEEVLKKKKTSFVILSCSNNIQAFANVLKLFLKF